MSNQTLKDWRDRVNYKTAEERSRVRYRNRMELMMVIATGLSAISTTAAVVVGVFHYRTATEQVAAAYSQMTAAGQNRTFEAFLVAFDETCEMIGVKEARPALFSIPKSPDEALVVRVFEERLNDVFKRRKEFSDLPKIVNELRKKLRYFASWSPSDRFVEDIRRMLDAFHLPDEEFHAKMNPTFDFRRSWKRDYVQINTLCYFAPNELIRTMRYGTRPNLLIPKVEFIQSSR